MNNIITNGLGGNQLVTQGYGYTGRVLGKTHGKSKLFEREYEREFLFEIYSKLHGELENNWNIFGKSLNKLQKDWICSGRIADSDIKTINLNSNLRGHSACNYNTSTKIFNPYVMFFLEDD